MLKFQKEILSSCTNKNHLLILSEGLGIMDIIRYELSLYDYDYTLTILINFTEEEVKFVSNKVNIKNLTNFSTEERNKFYKKGGVFYATTRTFITDLLNKNIEVKLISALFINHTEKIEEMSTECFIAQLVRKNNPDCIIKCYSDKPSYFANSLILLNQLFQSLRISDLILFPRFHNSITESLLPFEITEHKLKLNKEIKEIQVYLFDLIISLTNQYNYLLRKEKGKEISTDIILSGNILLKCDSFKMKQLIYDIYNIRSLVFLLYSVDLGLFYEKYHALFKEQRESEGTWITNLSSHLLLEKIEEYKNKEEIYFLNYKLKQFVSLIKENENKRICVLSKSKEVIDSLKNHFNNEIKGFSHNEFLLIKEIFDSFILLDPSIKSIRKLELLYSLNNHFSVDLLFFKESLEEEKYLLEIREEKDSFLQLIEQRSKQGLFFIEEEDNLDVKVIVDVREMRCSLPFEMYKHGISLDVCTLSVGDYLINSVCVERKEINDLISSINSGRLFNQVNHLVNLFVSPILLLEFQGRMSLNEYLKKVQMNKFIILLINFPNLRLLWSNSDKLTIKCITALEKKDDNNIINSKIDPELMEILLSIDGINYLNVNKIINSFTNLKEIVSSDEEKLIKVLGNVNGKKVFLFFREEFN